MAFEEIPWPASNIKCKTLAWVMAATFAEEGVGLFGAK